MKQTLGIKVMGESKQYVKSLLEARHHRFCTQNLI